MRGTVRESGPQGAAALIAEIIGIADRLRAELDAPCDERGVSGSRFAVLKVISESGEAGCSQRELAVKLDLSESNVSVLIEGLRKAGFLYRFRSKQDRRRSVLLLSEPGTEILSILSQARGRRAASLLDGLSSRQVTELRRQLAALVDQLDSNHGTAETPAMRRAS